MIDRIKIYIENVEFDEVEKRLHLLAYGESWDKFSTGVIFTEKFHGILNRG